MCRLSGVPGISMHKLNAHVAEKSGLGCFVAPCALFDLDSFTWQLAGVNFMASLCHGLKGKSDFLFEQHVPSSPFKTDGENPKPSHLQNSSFITLNAKFEELCGYQSPFPLQAASISAAISDCLGQGQNFYTIFAWVSGCAISAAPDRLC